MNMFDKNSRKIELIVLGAMLLWLIAFILLALFHSTMLVETQPWSYKRFSGLFYGFVFTLLLLFVAWFAVQIRQSMKKIKK